MVHLHLIIIRSLLAPVSMIEKTTIELTADLRFCILQLRPKAVSPHRIRFGFLQRAVVVTFSFPHRLRCWTYLSRASILLLSPYWDVF